LSIEALPELFRKRVGEDCTVIAIVRSTDSAAWTFLRWRMGYSHIT